MTAFGQPPSGGGFGPPPGSSPGGAFGPPGGGGFGPPPGSAPGAPFGQPPGGAYGPPMGGPPQGASGLAVAALVLACLSWVCGGIFFSIPAAIMAKIEMGNIARGESAQAGDMLSKAAFWVSIANIVLYVGIICLYAVIFVVAIAGSASSGGYNGGY